MTDPTAPDHSQTNPIHGAPLDTAGDPDLSPRSSTRRRNNRLVAALASSIVVMVAAIASWIVLHAGTNHPKVGQCIQDIWGPKTKLDAADLTIVDCHSPQAMYIVIVDIPNASPADYGDGSVCHQWANQGVMADVWGKQDGNHGYVLCLGLPNKATNPVKPLTVP